jgi:glutamine amidotransferase
MLVVIDYGAGNLRSVLHALRHLGMENVRLAHRPEDLEGATKLILPGVGAYGAGMQALHGQGLVQPIRDAVQQGIPYLGICLGMQFLFDFSDEMGHHEGLGILPGHVTRFENHPDLKVPHMGWNTIDVKRNSALTANLPDPGYAYFVHSYYCVPSEASDVLATVNYGLDFCVAVERNTIFGVQFHPEKSQTTGLQVLRNFLSLPDGPEYGGKTA